MTKYKKLNIFMTEENLNCKVVINAKESYETYEAFCNTVFEGLVKDIPKELLNMDVIQVGTSLTTGLTNIDIYAPNLMHKKYV